MPKQLRVLLATVLCQTSVWGASYSLKNAFEFSVKKLEVIKIQESLLEQSEEKRQQATGGILPNLSASASYLRQDMPKNTAADAPNTKANQSTVKATLTQPLFRGLREFAASRAAEDLMNAQKLNVQSARLLLYYNVAQNFYRVLSAETTLVNLHNLRDLSVKRVNDLAARSRVGRSRNSEVLTARLQVTKVQADIEGAEADLKQARDSFALTTGLDSKSALLDDSAPSLATLPNLSQLIALVDKRPDIEALRLQANAADESISIARGAHFPSIDLMGNYYFYRTGSLSDVKWDAGVSLTVPIFQGGSTQSQVREAVARKSQAELNLELTRRTAIRDVQDLYASVQHSFDQLRLLSEALALAQQSYKELHREYQLGLTTNIEVLQALNSVYETQGAYDRLRYTRKSNLVALDAAIGKLP